MMKRKTIEIVRLIASILFSTLALVGCASLSNRQKTILATVGGAVVGGSIGYLTTPQDGTSQVGHAALWGGATASAVGIASLFIFDEQKRSSDLEKQTSVMKKEIEALRGENTSSDPKLLYETTAPLGRELPLEYSHLIQPGKWSVYQLNQWIVEGESTLIHQDRMVRLIPPQFSPSNLSQEQGSNEKIQGNKGIPKEKKIQ